MKRGSGLLEFIEMLIEGQTESTARYNKQELSFEGERQEAPEPQLIPDIRDAGINDDPSGFFIYVPLCIEEDRNGIEHLMATGLTSRFRIKQDSPGEAGFLHRHSYEEPFWSSHHFIKGFYILDKSRSSRKPDST